MLFDCSGCYLLALSYLVFGLLLGSWLAARPAAAQTELGTGRPHPQPAATALSAGGTATLNGTVRDSLTRQPLPFASVSLANATHGATTDVQGRYTLAGVPAGRYELAATYLSYQLRQRPVVVSSQLGPVDVSLLPAAQQLAEVVVRPNPNREVDYQRFLELFLGASTFAKQCWVRDPDAVRIDYDAEQRALTATVPHALEVDNLALGYRLTFYDSPTKGCA